MASRISILRDCLRLTGNNQFGAIDDGSPEWEVPAAAWTAGCEWLLDEHDWNFATEISDEIEADVDGSDVAVPPSDPGYAYRFDRPDDALHVVKVMDTGGAKLADYRLVGNKIYANTDTVIVEYIVEPHPDDWPGLFIKAIKHCVFAGIYRGLNKDPQAAQREEAAAERAMGKSRPRTDMQEPGKTRFVSTLARARSRRRG
jgi:hypothetical protein